MMLGPQSSRDRADTGLAHRGPQRLQRAFATGGARDRTGTQTPTAARHGEDRRHLVGGVEDAHGTCGQ